MTDKPVALVVQEQRPELDGKENQDGPNQSRPQQQLHLLPCHLHHTGPAPVSTFFQTELLDDGATKAAVFRGNLILSRTMELPSGYKFYAVREESSGEGESSQKIFKIESASSSLDCWEFNELPGPDKKRLQDISAVLQVTKDLAS